MPANIWIMPAVDLTEMDNLMYDEDKNIRVVPAAELKKFPIATIQSWCVQRGVYQLPTQELIDFLREQIGSMKAIEICAGYGVIGKALGIHRTDSYMQTRPEMVEYYRSLRQEPISPPPDVQKMDANTAVKVLQPEIVVGCWVTQKFREGDKDGSDEGVDEIEMYKSVKKYIHVGNDGPHGSKRINTLTHDLYRFPWLVSRAKDQAYNHIRVWSHE